MRAFSALVGACALLGSVGSGAVLAQPVLEATRSAASALPGPVLTLRPSPGLRDLAERVEAVLELRTGYEVDVGEAPPPGLAEAVPAGHVALANEDGGVRVVLAALHGRSFGATVEVDGASAPDARAVALAVETLRDQAVDAVEAEAREDEAAEEAAAADRRAFVDVGDSQVAREGGLLRDVDLLVYARAYGGASTSSSAPMTGLGAGAGLCVVRQCLFVAGELPLGFADGSVEDLRYRYLTFSSGFYSRPFRFGALTPGATIGFLTRVGRFGEDMGIEGGGVDTDLGARGSLELAWEMVSHLDLMAEGGVDVTLDRHRIYSEGASTVRGDRWSPWLQSALRYRP